jgi:signal transduction histidine kinase/CheY-like chemotaxis protein
MKDAGLLTHETMLNLINSLDLLIYATDPETDEILFINEPMKKHYKIEGDVVGRKCYELLQEGMTSRCDFCPCHKLKKEPDSVVVWEEYSTLTGYTYRNTDRLIDWTDGKKIHLHHSVDITESINHDNLMKAVNSAAALLLSADNFGDIETPLKMGLELIGRSVKADRVHIWRSETIDNEPYYVYQYGWFSELGDKTKLEFQNYKFLESEVAHWKEKFIEGEIVGGPISKLSKFDRDSFSKYSAKLAVAIPLFLGEEFWGFIVIEDCKTERDMSEDEINILRSVSMMMANAINQHVLANSMNEAHERSLLMLDTSPICAQIWTKDLRTIDCNEAGVKLYGFKDKQEYAERFITSCSPVYQPDGQLSSKKAVEFVHRAFKEGICRFDWVHKMPDKDILIPAHITLVRSRYKNEDIVIGYTRDMREQHALLSRLNYESKKFEETAHWYKSILDAISLPISVTDKNRKWTFANKALTSFINMDVEDMLGKHCSHVANEICKTENCAVERALRGEKQTYFSHGEDSFVCDVEILRNLDDEISGFIEVIQNISHIKELTKAAAEAEMASKEKSSFLASMSHEIRTPMNAILGVTEILLQKEKVPHDLHEGLIKIHNSSNMLLGILNDILDFSKVEAGKMEIVPAPYVLAELINDSISLNIMRIESKPIDFEIYVDENIPAKLVGDELRIKQILNNLLSNAFKYTDKGKVKLTITAERECKKDVLLIISVHDTGIGMKEHQVKRLFEEYSRFDEGISRGVEGTGLGMTITNHLLQLMGGEIMVESVYGQGSCFTVKLYQVAVSEEVIGAVTSESLRNFRDTHIVQREKSQVVREYMPYGSVLVVDDVEPNLYVAEGLMRPYGLKIETVMSGNDAIEKIRDGNLYDIIFMDHMMPVMDGIEATKIIRGMNYTAPIVALTANALTGQAEVFMQNGFDEFISKPVDTRQLNFVLNKLIRDKQPPEVIEAARSKVANEVAAGKNITSVVTALRNIDCLNVDIALSVFSGLEDVYEKTVRLSARLFPETIKKMDGYLADGNLKDFAIEIHGMKGVFRSIGASELGSKASCLENAALSDDKITCDTAYPTFRLSLVDFMQQLNKALAQIPVANKEKIDLAALAESLSEAKIAAESYDAMLNPLKNFSFNDEAEKLLEAAIFALEEFNCPSAVADIVLIEDILKKL